MACSIALAAVNGLVQPGQLDPTVLRVTGVAMQCAQVTVSSPVATSSVTVAVDPNGRFRAELAIAGTPAPKCGDTITVRAACVGAATCFVEEARTLACCELTTLFFRAIAPVGQLAPTMLSVQGVVHGCVSDQVVISSSVTATTSPITVDFYTGAFSVMIPLTAAVQCDDKIMVTASCSSGTGCTRTINDRMECAGCYRAQVSVVTAPCVGTPPRQPVTLNASIAVPAGAVQDFFWAFGDGQVGAAFTIDNSAGTGAVTHAHAETHDYVPGTYVATLKIKPPPHECAEVSVTVVAQCTTGACPSINLDPPVISSQCTNGKRTVALTSHVTTPAGPNGVVYWDYGDTTFSPPDPVTGGAVTNTAYSHDYSPGTYTARLKTLIPAGCPDYLVQLTIPPCAPPQCTLLVQGIALQVGACDPATGKRTVTATGTVNNTDPSDLYFWQWDANPATVGLPAALGTTQTHAYAAPGSAQSSYHVTLTVVRGTTCVSSVTKTVTIEGCGGGCPAITDTLIGTPGTCTPDRLRRTISLNATIGGTGVTQYEWNCGDGTVLTIPGSAGPLTSHEFAPGTFTVTLKATGPGACEAVLSKQVVVDLCCPTVADIAVAPGTCANGATTRPVTLTAVVTGTGVGSFDWSFGDGTPNVTSTTPTAPVHSYTAPGTFTATVTAHTPGCPDVSASKSVAVATCTTTTTTGLSSCAVLLWTAIGFLLAGALVGIIGCVLTYFVALAQIGLILEAIGLTLFSIGALLFLIWWIVCRLLTACAVILAVRDFVRILIGIFAVLAIILWIVSFFIPHFMLCAIFASVYGVSWGVVLALIDWIADDRRCLIANPSGGGGAAGSSSGALTESGGATRLRASDFSPRASMSAAAPAPAGLGDLIKSATALMGIQTCAPCQQRADRLNAAFPFGDLSAERRAAN